MIDLIYDKLMGFDWFQSFVAVVLNLDSTRLWLIVILAAVLVAYLVFKKAGVAALSALLFVYMLTYILFQYDLINFYEKRAITNEEHNKTIEEELQK